MSNFDMNFSYHTSKLTDSFCDIDMVQNEDVADALKLVKIGSTHTCATRMGRASALGGFAGFRSVSYVETHCVHRGDPQCRVRIEYDRIPQGRDLPGVQDQARNFRLLS